MGSRGWRGFRVNVYKDRGTVAACLRALPSKIPSFESLNLPPVVREMFGETPGVGVGDGARRVRGNQRSLAAYD